MLRNFNSVSYLELLSIVGASILVDGIGILENPFPTFLYMLLLSLVAPICSVTIRCLKFLPCFR